MQESSTLQSPWQRFFQDLIKTDAETKQRLLVGFITGLGFLVGIAFMSLTILRDHTQFSKATTPVQEISNSPVQTDATTGAIENVPVEVGDVQYYAHEPATDGPAPLDKTSIDALEALRSKLNTISNRIEQLDHESTSLQNQLASDRAQVKSLVESETLSAQSDNHPRN